MAKQSTVAIIGAGIGGLSVGAYLALRGFQVDVFEALGRVGGFVHSFERERYTFEASTHQIGGFADIGYMTRVFELLGVRELPVHRLASLYESCFLDERGRVSERYTLPTEPQKIVDELARHFPEKREAIEAYLREVELIAHDLMRLKRLQREAVTPAQALDAIGALMLRNGRPGGVIRKLGAKRYRHLVENIERTWADLLGDFEGTLHALLSQQWFYIGTPPSEAPAVIAAIILYLFFDRGGGRIEGGTRRLVEGLAKTITDSGGTIHVKTPVRAILVERGRARGVVTSDGMSFRSDCTVSNVNSQHTMLEMVGEHQLPSQYAQQLRTLRLSRSAFQVFVGAKIRLEEHGCERDTVFYNATNDTERNALEGAGGPTRQSPLVMVNYSIEDSSFAPPGSSSLIALEYDDYARWEGLSRADYLAQKAATQDLLLDKLERATGAPIRANAEVLFSATPLTFQRYSSGRRGEVFGPAATREQSLMKRTPPETPITGLYLAGASTQPAHGVSAVIDAGIVLGRTIVKSHA